MKRNWKQRMWAMCLAIAMCAAMLPTIAFAEPETKKIASASDFPEEISVGEVYELTADITLTEGQQISNLAGTLDGKGHSITLAGKPLADQLSGTIQNLGVTGELKAGGVFGSVAVTLTGAIQNCYSTVNLSADGWDDVGGLVGTLTGGSIRNSYAAGSNSAMFADGLVGVATNSEGASLSNCYFVTGWSAVGVGIKYVTVTNCSSMTKDRLKTTDAVDGLNTDIVDTGYSWALPTGGENSGYPVLKEGAPSVEVNWSGLQNAIQEAEEKEPSAYTEESWSALQSVLKTANELLQKEDATQAEVNAAQKEVSDAVQKLVKKKPSEPMALPEDSSVITYITSASQLESITFKEDGYYVLQNDITIDGWYWPTSDFQGVFDGQGHTVTFQNPYFYGLFRNVGESGIVQNVSLQGKMEGTTVPAPLGDSMKGAVLNCYSQVEAQYGFAKRMEGGEFHNCYSIAGTKGAFVGTNAGNTGKIQDCYWAKELGMTEESGVVLINSYAKNEKDLKALDFVVLLNQNKGENGIGWGRSSSGYPYFGENQEYTPEEDNPVLPESRYDAFFVPYIDETARQEIDDYRIELIQSQGAFNGYIGKFVLDETYEAPEGSSVVWSCRVNPENVAAIAEESGELYLYKEGTVIVTATQKNADGTTETLANILVNSIEKPYDSIKLYIDEVEVTNGKYTVAGSGDHRISVKARYEGESAYQYVASSAFYFESREDTGEVYHLEDSSAFYFTKAGTATFTVTSRANADLKAEVEVTSVYVPVMSVMPAISGSFELHGRNANSSNGRDFLPNYSGVIVTPENASNATDYTITSSQPEVGNYVPSMVVGYVPYKAGTTTYTAFIEDKNPDTGEIRVVSGPSSTVTYTYKNPLQSITAEDTSLEVASGEKISAGITLKGTLDEYGYSISEPTLVWTYDKPGIVSISQGSGAFKREADAPDVNQYFQSGEYTIRGLSEGTVVATGTPIDRTGGAEPIVLTITVTGNGETVDLLQTVNSGIEHAAAYMENMYSDSRACAYGAEWYVFAMLRAGKKLDAKWLEDYYLDVVETLKESDRLVATDYERVALALSAMGKDITDVEGINLAEKIYNYENLNYGSNALAFALLALDAKHTDIPENAVWTRDRMLEALLEFQNAEGFFGLSDNAEASVDMTAMVLQALAPYRKTNTDVANAVEKALNYLERVISADFDYEGNSNSTAQVLLAMAVLGEDITVPGFGTKNVNMITRLMEYKTANGFSYLMGEETNAMATVQIIQAFDAYRLYLNGESYWNLTSVETTEKDAFGKEVTPDETGKLSPGTGDTEDMISWLCLMMLTTVVGGSVLLTGRKKEYEKNSR